MRKKERKKKGRERKKKLAPPSTISRSATVCVRLAALDENVSSSPKFFLVSVVLKLVLSFLPSDPFLGVQMKLAKERDSLAATAKKLARNLAEVRTI